MQKNSFVTAPTTKRQWEKLLRRIPGYDPFALASWDTFDTETATRALQFFPMCLRHVKGHLGGDPFELEPWLQSITANIFGWKRADGTRRFRECFLYVPRKNAKTFWSAGMVLYMMVQDDEPGAELYSAAADREQASLVYAHAKGMVQQEPELARRIQIYDAVKSLVYHEKGSSYKVLSADAQTKHGFNSHLVVVDELHAHRNGELVEVLKTSMGARRQPLLLYTTTADYARESICNDTLDYARKVRDGIVEDRGFLPVIYEAPKVCMNVDTIAGSWRDKKVWAIANPNLGKSISLEFLQAECKRAQEQPSFLNSFLRLYLNIQTQQDMAWLDMEQWRACAGVVNEQDLLGAPCWAGFDLASTSDLIALVLYFPENDHAVSSYFWAPEDTIRKRTAKGFTDYQTWQRQGFLRSTPGNVADYDIIRAELYEIAEKFDLQTLALDRWNATEMATQLQGNGLNVVLFGQGFASMSGPSRELERLVASRQLMHGNNPVLSWCASNVHSEQDAAGNIKPSKAKSSQKIDGIVALCMALGVAMTREVSRGSVYETRGIEVF